MCWYSRIRSAFKDNWRKILETINVVSWHQEDFNSSILVMEVEVISPVDWCWESLSIQAAELPLLEMWCSLHSVRRRSRLGLLVLPSTSAMAKSQWSITRYFLFSKSKEHQINAHHPFGRKRSWNLKGEMLAKREWLQASLFLSRNWVSTEIDSEILRLCGQPVRLKYSETLTRLRFWRLQRVWAARGTTLDPTCIFNAE